VCIDLPGHGKSGCFSEIHTMDAMAEVVKHVLDELTISSATFIGHSMGGYVSLAMIDLFESYIAKIILLNSTTAADDDDLKKNRNRAVSVLAQNKDLAIRSSFSNLYSESARIQFASEIEQQKLEALQFPKEGLQAAHLGMRDRPDRTLILRDFSREKHIIAGIADAIVPIASLEHIAKNTDTPILKVEGGHMLLTENWEKIVKILRFIE
jgi:pimeloyl-ACP methyl ester carboxylesterase